MRSARFILATASLATVAILAGCKSNPAQAPILNGDPNAANSAANGTTDQLGLLNVPDGTQPAYSTAAPASAPAPVGAQPTATRTAAPVTRVAGVQYQQQPAASGENYPQQQQQDTQYADEYSQLDDPYAQYVDNNVPVAETAPPPIPEYEQPVAPGPDYYFTPGYWDYANTGYYWVPGAWVQPPYSGALWTPGFWGNYGGRYRYHHGYWGRNVGFYGGINFGFGYLGVGYGGGRWNNNHFYYNRAYNRVYDRAPYVYNQRINNVYINNSRVSYYGGRGGINRAPLRSEMLARAQQITPPMRMQMQNRVQASQNRQQFFSQNRGRPAEFAARQPFAADRGIQRPAALSPAVLQQRSNEMRQQQQQRLQQQNQINQQRQQQTMQRGQQLQQRQQALQQRNQTQQVQQREQLNQQRQNAMQQRQGQQQQRGQQLQQRQANLQQQNQQQIQQRQVQQQQQQRAQQTQQRQQENVQRQQQVQQQRVQQQQQQAQQRTQQMQQRQQENVQRQQAQQQQRAQQQQQRVQQQQQQRVQQQQQRVQQQQQRVQQHVQHTEAPRGNEGEHRR